MELKEESRLAKKSVGNEFVVDDYFLLGMSLVMKFFFVKIICVNEHKPNEEAFFALVPGVIFTGKFLADIISNLKKELLIM